MFKNLNYQFKGHHLLVSGKEERYAYMDNENEIGKIHVYVNENSMYIDYFEINEQHRLKGWGNKMVKEIFSHFPQVNKIWGLSEEKIMDNFWAKQKGFHFVGEGHDEYEGYLIFEINKSTFITVLKTTSLDFFEQDQEVISFEGYRLNIHLNDNIHLKQGEANYVNAWCYDHKKGGLRLEKMELLSNSKGLYVKKFGKLQYLDEMKKTSLRRTFINK